MALNGDVCTKGNRVSQVPPTRMGVRRMGERISCNPELLWLTAGLSAWSLALLWERPPCHTGDRRVRATGWNSSEAQNHRGGRAHTQGRRLSPLPPSGLAWRDSEGRRSQWRAAWMLGPDRGESESRLVPEEQTLS